MTTEFRDFLQRLIERGELRRVSEEVDLRQLSARVAASPRALWFERVKGYEMGVVSGILGSRNRMAASLGCDHRDIGKTFLRKLQDKCRPVMVPTGPVKDVIRTGKDVDLTALPVPLVSRLDGGPTSPRRSGLPRSEYGRNVGMYRLMIRTGRETSIDLVSASDLKLFYERAFEAAGRCVRRGDRRAPVAADGRGARGAGRTGRIRTCRRTGGRAGAAGEVRNRRSGGAGRR